MSLAYFLPLKKDSRPKVFVFTCYISFYFRSKSGSECGDRDEDGPAEKPSTPRKMEPAPPPKENAWVRRSQQNQGLRNSDPLVCVQQGC